MLYLAAGLPRDRFQVRFLLLSERGPLAAEAEKLDIPIEVLGLNRLACVRPGPHCLSLAAKALRRYRNLTRDTDIVDAWTVPAYTFAGLTRRFTDVPVVMAGRRSLPDVHRSRTWYREWAKALAMRGVDAVVANSQAGADAAINGEGIDPERVHVIHNAVTAPAPALAADRVALRASWSATDEDAVIGCVGSFRPGKGHDALLTVATSLRQNHPNARFIFIGDGPLRESIEAQVAQRRLTNVVVDATHGDARSVYGALDLVVQASETEGLPNAVLEAAAAGRPIVATAVGGTTEILTDGINGLLVPRRDVPALERSIDRLLRDRELRTALGDAARVRAADFTVAKLVDRTAALYAALLENSGN
jgi:glycosyltransferase involved in cell wall biosynthesis